MIFASDLVRTLIYSRKSFRAPIEDESIQLIETLDGKEISFISHKTISLLKIATALTFHPSYNKNY